ncbi:uncharacterized protein ACO6RY_11295 [Pungitius sinensis]
MAKAEEWAKCTEPALILFQAHCKTSCFKEKLAVVYLTTLITPGKRTTGTEAMTSKGEPKHDVPLQIRNRETVHVGDETGRSPIEPAPERGFRSASSALVNKGGFTCKPHNTSRLRQNHEVDHWSN